MENASKALIIAGAILLSILIIGLGMYIYNMAADAITDTGLDATQVQAHNEPYDRYLGTRSGSDVRTLVKNVTNNKKLILWTILILCCIWLVAIICILCLNTKYLNIKTYILALFLNISLKTISKLLKSILVYEINGAKEAEL